MADAEVVTVKRPTKGTEIEPGKPKEVENPFRPEDTPQRGVEDLPIPNSTFASRKAARDKANRKQVDQAENKAVKSAETKASGR